MWTVHCNPRAYRCLIDARKISSRQNSWSAVAFWTRSHHASIHIAGVTILYSSLYQNTLAYTQASLCLWPYPASWTAVQYEQAAIRFHCKNIYSSPTLPDIMFLVFLKWAEKQLEQLVSRNFSHVFLWQNVVRRPDRLVEGFSRHSPSDADQTCSVQTTMASRFPVTRQKVVSCSSLWRLSCHVSVTNSQDHRQVKFLTHPGEYPNIYFVNWHNVLHGNPRLS